MVLSGGASLRGGSSAGGSCRCGRRGLLRVHARIFMVQPSHRIFFFPQHSAEDESTIPYPLHIITHFLLCLPPQLTTSRLKQGTPRVLLQPCLRVCVVLRRENGSAPRRQMMESGVPPPPSRVLRSKSPRTPPPRLLCFGLVTRMMSREGGGGK